MKVDASKVRTLLILSLFFACSMFSACKSETGKGNSNREKCGAGDSDACEQVIKETANNVCISDMNICQACDAGLETACVRILGRVIEETASDHLMGALGDFLADRNGKKFNGKRFESAMATVKASGQYVSHHKNGKLKVKGYYKNGLKSGYWQKRDEEGRLVYEGGFNDGEKVGYWEEISYNKLLEDTLPFKFRGFYKKGKKQGKWAVSLQRDDLQLDGLGFSGTATFKDDKRDGYWEECLDLTGDSYCIKGSYKMDKEDGYWEECSYVNGDPFCIKGSYKMGEKDGTWKEYNSDGRLLKEGQYVDGRKEGTWKEYDSDGRLLEEGQYVDGRKEGVWKNGDSKVLYQNGYEVEPTTQTFVNYATYGDTAALAFCLEKSIDINKRDKSGYNAVTKAAEKGMAQNLFAFYLIMEPKQIPAQKGEKALLISLSKVETKKLFL